MEKMYADVLEAIKVMQLAKRAAKIFPEGISKIEVYQHMVASGKDINFRALDDIYAQLKTTGAVRIYPTMHDLRAVIDDL